ncbi:hypothetical protein PPYR_01508 [Photinus pyralis]|uniref:Uncharacterized protein n=1 Tax=Photinus pyralis TaxID=7054 RepID=A0A1Y1LC10_PHOPY|nr:uncharacterized protein LOC116175094 [Photinus pyralis]XP_031349061.1 uncharacterized protein LOC116175094 [Photinus pyralis]XP_031349068.1 uncharacterized protein LOC116175094 [Photinus pyralis]KAB0804538.1 hypothetical protein PPYR_01508 [Photinus pyralis]
MQFKLLVLFLLITISAKSSASCNEECKDTEYGSYINCLRRRIKRSADCGNSVEKPCANCECGFCVVNSCPGHCGKCCEAQPPCASKQCCHRTCHSRCKSSSCRIDCRKNCVDMLIADGLNVTIPDKPRHNITTVIHLHNTVNTTNVVDLPEVQVNTTNVNNITSYEEETKHKEIKEKCCHIISPRHCTKLDQYPYAKCVHYRKKACGSFCVAPILHEQSREICFENDAGETCRQQKVYIPQPQPTCSYQPIWPYVFCGNVQQQFCVGCYQQSNYQFPPPGCPYSCYDDGYGQGPYYRQGPFYRPGFSHIPSCFQTGTCPTNWNYGQNYPRYGYPAMHYPPTSYPYRVHMHDIDVQYPPPSYSYPVPIFPPHISTGYQYPPPRPIYILPPEVDIQAVITHPPKNTTYAEITISKSQREEQQNDAISALVE